MAADERSRERRHQLMAAANTAYAEGDESKLHTILDEWLSSPESVTGDGTGAELVRTLRTIHRVRLRLARIGEEIAQLEASRLFILWEEVKTARKRGVDLLAQMVAHVAAKTEAARERLKAMGADAR